MNNDDAETEPDEVHRALWAAAKSLGELGELMARWITGEITYQPAYFGVAPDDETSALVPLLAAANRAGYLTDFSQPGEDLDNGWSQRASVGGFCDEATVERLRRACASTDAIALYFPPGIGWAQVAVSRDGASENTWVGAPYDAGDILDLYGRDLSPDGIAALATAWQVHLVDPVWGRNDLLWRLLADGLDLTDIELPS